MYMYLVKRVLGNAANTAFLAQVYRKDCLSVGSHCLSGGDSLSNDDLLLFSKVFYPTVLSHCWSQDTDPDPDPDPDVDRRPGQLQHVYPNPNH